MRIHLPVLVLLLTASIPVAASTPGEWSLRVSGGASHPTLVSSAGAGMPVDGSTFDVALGYAVAPAVRLIAGVSHDRFATGGGWVTIPEVRWLGSEPFGLTTAQLGFEAHAALPSHRVLSGYAGLAGGVGWLRQGSTRWEDSSRFPPTVSTAGGGRSAHPVVAAAAGIRVPSGLALADLDLGWTSRWLDTAAGALRTDAFRAGLVLHR